MEITEISAIIGTFVHSVNCVNCVNRPDSIPVTASRPRIRLFPSLATRHLSSILLFYTTFECTRYHHMAYMTFIPENLLQSWHGRLSQQLAAPTCHRHRCLLTLYCFSPAPGSVFPTATNSLILQDSPRPQNGFHARRRSVFSVRSAPEAGEGGNG